MIRSVYFEGMNESHRAWGERESFNDFEGIKYLLENTGDIFIFIHTKEQAPLFYEMYYKYGYGGYEYFKQEGYITNGNYKDQGRKLKMIVLKGKGENYVDSKARV